MELETSRMPRLLRIYLLGCLAISFAFLAWHAWEPLRLNVGDPWSDAAALSSIQHARDHRFPQPLISDAARPAHDPLAGTVDGALGKLGVSEPVTPRLISLAFALVGAWLVFLYARRIWGDIVALLATALLATSLLWMMYADSIDRPPIVETSCVLALWGVACAIESKQRRHYAAALAGSFGCMFGGIEAWGLLVVGVLFTVYIKRGNPLARGNLRFLIVCALGALVGLAARALLVDGSAGFSAGALDWQAAVDRSLVTQPATLLRRYALLFTPMFWITLGYATWRTIRAPSLASVIEDGMTWLLAVAVIVLWLAAPDSASPMRHAQPLLMFYAVGTAILIARRLEGGRLSRGLAVAWAVVAPAWGLALMFSHPRAVLDDADVARTRAYLAANDANDFVISNLLANGPIQTAFDRHLWPALELDSEGYAHVAQLQLLNLFDATGTAYVHALVFTTPDSRFVDRALGQLVLRGRLASVTGWPYLVRGKANEIIRDYDRRVRQNLEAVGAKQVLHLGNYDVYRVDRDTVLAQIGRDLPVVRAIDLSSPASDKHKLLGWGAPQPTVEDEVGASPIIGQTVCSNPVLPRAGALTGNGCETVLTQYGISVPAGRGVARAQLMIRLERACELRVTVELASSFSLARLAHELAPDAPIAQLAVERVFAMPLALSINDASSVQCEPAKRVTFLVPQRSVRAGLNILTLQPGADVAALAIDPICEPAP